METPWLRPPRPPPHPSIPSVVPSKVYDKVTHHTYPQGPGYSCQGERGWGESGFFLSEGVGGVMFAKCRPFASRLLALDTPLPPNQCTLISFPRGGGVRPVGRECLSVEQGERAWALTSSLRVLTISSWHSQPRGHPPSSCFNTYLEGFPLTIVTHFPFPLAISIGSLCRLWCTCGPFFFFMISRFLILL